MDLFQRNTDQTDMGHSRIHLQNFASHYCISHYNIQFHLFFRKENLCYFSIRLLKDRQSPEKDSLFLRFFEVHP